MIWATHNMVKHRARPVEKKSQRDAERHFRSAPCTFAEYDRDFAYAQRSTGAHYGLENNFETARFRCQFQQLGTANGKEAAH